MIEEVGCSVVLIVNKWDTQSKNQKFTTTLAAERIRAKMSYLKYAPIVFTSALRKQGLENLGDLLEEIMHQRHLKIPTHEFTEWVREATTKNNPGNAKFYLSHQSGSNPPSFVCHVSNPDKIHFSLQRNLINLMREKWGFMGSPIRLRFLEGKSNRTAPRKKSSGKHSPF
jgi:GTP-binding protein